jgi:hypothetical protein
VAGRRAAYAGRVTADPVPEVVTLHLWRVPRRQVPTAVARMALDRRLLRATPGLRFAKSLGTGDGRTFTLRDADPCRWGLLATWRSSADAAAFESGPVARAWDRVADERWRADLSAVSSRGRWAGREPFGLPSPRRTAGPVAAITRARLRLRNARSFWRAVPDVSASLAAAPGLRLAVGIGEAPLGLQGTFSLWSSSAALTDFASRGAAHADAVRRTPVEGWYAEELFARFAVLRTEGTVDGRDPLAGAGDAVSGSGGAQKSQRNSAR